MRQIKLRTGDCKDITRTELESLAKGILTRYRDLGANFQEEDFFRSAEAGSISDLEEAIKKYLKEFFEANKDGLLVDYSNPRKVNENFDIEKISPNRYPLSRILNAEKYDNLFENSAYVSFRRLTIEGCYLFAYGKTRSQKLENPSERDYGIERRDSEPAGQIHFKSEYDGEEDKELEKYFIEAVEKKNLHYVALVAHGRILCRCHALFVSGVKKLLLGKQGGAKLKELEELASGFADLLQEVDKRFKEISQGLLYRILFDMEQGGIVYEYIFGGVYIIGIALDQSSLHDGEDTMLDLATKLKKHLGIGTGRKILTQIKSERGFDEEE